MMKATVLMLIPRLRWGVRQVRGGSVRNVGDDGTGEAFLELEGAATMAVMFAAFAV